MASYKEAYQTNNALIFRATLGDAELSGWLFAAVPTFQYCFRSREEVSQRSREYVQQVYLTECGVTLDQRKERATTL